MPGWLAVAAIMSLACPRSYFVKTACAAPPATQIEELVMYAIDADTHELLRYTFDTDEFVRIGVVVDQDGNVVTDIEGLSFISTGPYKGIYGLANWYESRPTTLVRINPMDATAYVYPVNIGHEKGEGMVAARDQVTGDWFLIGASKHDDPGDKDAQLFTIDPATGASTSSRDVNERYQGLAMAANGDLYGVTRGPSRLYRILPNGNENFIANVNGYNKVEAMEWAFGDNTNQVDCSAVPPSWTVNGILFGFDDDKDALMIINPANGDTVRYNCAFQTIDCEGMVFTTQFRDSYGEIVVDACD